MCSLVSISQLPSGTSVRTHSALRSDQVMLVGSSIHAVYDTGAHTKKPMNGDANRRRRRRRAVPLSRRKAQREPDRSPAGRPRGWGAANSMARRDLEPPAVSPWPHPSTSSSGTPRSTPPVQKTPGGPAVDQVAGCYPPGPKRKASVCGSDFNPSFFFFFFFFFFFLMSGLSVRHRSSQ